jgi:fatty-acid peroxygenase
MPRHHGVRLDQSVPLALEGFGWLPNRRRRSPDGVVECRLMGRRATGLCGPDAARFFYDEERIRRHGALPPPVLSTLFGHGAVHTLDGAAHRVRKAMFLALTVGDGVPALADSAGRDWDIATSSWHGSDEVVLFRAASRALTRSVCTWTGIPVADAEVPALADDLLAMVDGFATAGPRHWKARQARRRRENWLAGLVEQVRAGTASTPAGSAVAAVATHRDVDGELLDPCVAAVELINIIRPTVAVSWFLAFTGHALYRWPTVRERLRTGDPAYATAFAHEVRRFYPFAPFVGGQAIHDLSYRGHDIPAGSMVLLDLYGQNHDPHLWPDPYRFDPDRFIGRQVGAFELIPQGGGDPRTGHRCPGEQITVALLETLPVQLARLTYDVPAQDLTIPLHRIPTRPASGFVMTNVRTPDRAAGLS